MEDNSQRELLIDEVISRLKHFAKLYGIESIFIAGGYCRSIYMNRKWEINDIDVASAYHEQAIQLGGLFASEILNTTPEFYHHSGAAHITYKSDLGSIDIDFQGKSVNQYMYNQDIKDFLRTNNIDDVPLMNNLYGRDFTINTLIFSLSTNQLLDPLRIAEKDLNNRTIRSVLPANLLMKYNPVAILRAIRFAITYDFHIDAELRKHMKNSVESLSKTIAHERIVKEMVRILKINPQKAIEAFEEYGLTTILLDKEVKNLLRMELINA